MRILSLNAWGGRLHDALVSYLADVDADIVCLQEVVRTQDAEADWLTYRDGGAELLQRANLFGDVQRALPGHQAFFCAAARGPLFDGERPVASDWGLATFVRREIPLIGQTQDFVHGTYLPDGWGSHPRARNAHAVRLFDPSSGRTLTVAHMHGLRDLSGKDDTPARHVQAATFLDVIARTRKPQDGVVACGDFNVLPDSETLKALAAAGFTDLVTKGGHEDTRTSFYAKTPRFADYMLVSDDLPIRRFDVVEQPEVSDHRALLLDL